MKLIPMTDYVLEQNNYRQQRFSEIVDYAIFLKQPLELWMFVPCDEDGNVLLDGVNWNKNFYKKAKERCLFDINIELSTVKFHISQKRTIEYFTTFEIQLTKTAIKQLGL